MIWILIILLTSILLIDALLIVLFIYNFKEYKPTQNLTLPKVSVLIAVRNEEKNISRCLGSLLRLSYPLDKLEILIGNDASEDDSLIVLRQYENENEHIKVLDIVDQVGGQKGKANVLAQLAKQANGDYFLITDADMELPEHWIQHMLSAVNERVGLAIGVTKVGGDSMQNLDWLFSLGIVKVITDLGLPVTGMGNNMIITREAYQSVGGYEKIPFSITEDFELFRHVKQQGYQCTHVFQREVLGTTLPIKGFLNLLNQRKRWMRGAIQLPIPMVTLLCLQSSFYVCLGILFFINPDVAAVLLVGKISLRLFFIGMLKRKLNLPFELMLILIYELYSVVISISTTLYFLIPSKVKWKGREY